MHKRILMVCDAGGGGIYEYAHPIYLKIKDKINIKLLKDRKLRNKFGGNSYKLLQTKISWKFIINQYLNKVFV